MNILFLTIGRFESIDQFSIYADLLRKFKNDGHSVYIVNSLERRESKKTYLEKKESVEFLRVRVGNITRCSMIEKGFSTLSIGYLYKKAINKFFHDIRFDLILYSTPPITLCGVVKAIKQRDSAHTYLLLKDIFPQNAIDIDVLTKTGIKGLIYNYFRQKEKKLYRISDYIGCMSQANVDYVLKHNPAINPEKVEICPNSVEVVDMSVDEKTRNEIRRKYDIPLDKKVFVYGGNLGKPQGIDFMIECLKSQEKNEDVFFLIVGDGTEFNKIEAYINRNRSKNVKLMKRLPKVDYDIMVGACDVGMIFLDHRFTIPNFPSRMLSYMQAKIPVLAVTDPNTDIGNVIVNGGFGWWCESNNIQEFAQIITKITHIDDITKKGISGFRYLVNHYDVGECYRIIISHFQKGVS